MNTSKNRISMNKGYTEKGFAEKVYHLHIRLPHDHDELYFLSYLQMHPAIAKEYETLKLHLWKRYPHDRDGYTEAKTDFIRTYTERAKREYGNRWEWYSVKKPGENRAFCVWISGNEYRKHIVNL